MRKNKKGIVCIIIGMLLITASILLVVYNIYIQNLADQSSQKIEEEIEKILESDDKDDEDRKHLYEDNPDMEMPVEFIDGYDYIGILEIPSFGLKLPVNSEWDYKRLKKSPCRYTGSVYQNDLIICAHNYSRHFGNIKNLKNDDIVIFTDMLGNNFQYRVLDIEILKPYDSEEMIDGDWDLTLFTCTIGGAVRVTVRCDKIE